MAAEIGAQLKHGSVFFGIAFASLVIAAGCVFSSHLETKSAGNPKEMQSTGLANGLPEELLFHAEELASIASRLAAGEKSLSPAIDFIIGAADSSLDFKAVSVMDKAETADSGDKHDYFSLSRYGWPDPNKPGGLPYIIRDGMRSPETDSVPDKKNLQNLIQAAAILSLAYHLTGEEKYADKAAKLLRTWFLDPATRMNPNACYAQVLRGHGVPHGRGIIDFVTLAPLFEFTGFIDGSKAWTSADRQAIKKWLGDFLDWLMTSTPGLFEASALNNHGTWYDTQVAAIAIATGKEELAKRVVEASKAIRIARQIDPDGRQRLETSRTLGLHYSIYNLCAFFRLADIGDRAGVDLWHYETSDGRSIRKALDWLMPYLAKENAWPYEQIGKLDPADACVLLLEAAKVFHDPEYSELAQRLAGKNLKIILRIFQTE